MEIMHGHHVLDGVIAQFVGRAVDQPGLRSPAGHPNRKAERMVVTPIAIAGIRRTAKFARPKNQRILQHAARLQVLDQCGDRLVRHHRIRLVALAQFVMLVPSAIIATVEIGRGDLHEAHARLHQPTGAQALQAIGALMLIGGIETVELLDRLGLAVQIQYIGRQRLHAVGHFKVGDGRLNRTVIGRRRQKLAVLAAQGRHLHRL